LLHAARSLPPKGTRASLAFNVLVAGSSSSVRAIFLADSLPETNAHQERKGEKHTEGDGETPDSLDLVAGRLINSDKAEIGQSLGDIDGPRGKWQGGGVCAEGWVCLCRESCAVEHGQGLPDERGNNNGGDEQNSVEDGGEEKWKHVVVVEDISDDNVDDSSHRLATS